MHCREATTSITRVPPPSRTSSTHYPPAEPVALTTPDNAYMYPYVNTVISPLTTTNTTALSPITNNTVMNELPLTEVADQFSEALYLYVSLVPP